MHVPHAHLIVVDKLISMASRELQSSGQVRTQKCPCALMEPMTLALVFCPGFSSSLCSSKRLVEPCCMKVMSGRNPQWASPRKVGNGFCMASSPEERSPSLYFVRTVCFWSNTVLWVSSADCNTTENITSSKEFG